MNPESGAVATRRVLDLGSGKTKLPGAVGVDIRPFPEIDVVYDLSRAAWPFKDDVFDRVRANDVLEHIPDFLTCMNELHRVCRDGALVEIRLPFMGGVHAATDPTHLRAGTSRTFDYFDPSRNYNAYEYSPAHLRVLGFRYVRGYLDSRLGRRLKRLDRFLLPLCERHHDAFEFYFAGVYPVHNIEYVLRVVKDGAGSGVTVLPKGETGSTARRRTTGRPRGVVAVVHPAFDTVGGAELLALRQAHLMFDAGASVELFTFRWTPHVWRDSLTPFALHAYAEVEEHFRKPPLPTTVTDAPVNWLSERLWGCSIAIGHNYPASAALAAADFAGPRIWYCHEPPRRLHAKGANPTLAAHLGLSTLRNRAVRKFAWNIAVPAMTGALMKGWHARLCAEDVRLASRFDAIWANSEFTRDNVRRVYGGVPTEVVYPIVSVAAPKGRHGLRRDRLNVLSMTRLESHKNVEPVVAAVARLARKARIPVSLHIIGDGPSRNNLEHYAQALAPKDTVRFHGYLPTEAVESIAASCDVFASVPLDEPFGMVFPEAMLRGLLVVGPDHGGPLEILDDGRLGFPADAFAIDSIVEALEHAWSLTDAEADALRERAANSCERFAPHVIGPRIRALLGRYGVELPDGSVP